MRNPSLFSCNHAGGPGGAMAVAVLIAAAVITARAAPADRSVDLAVNAHVLRPKQLPPPAPETLKLPTGFVVERFAENLGNTRILAVGKDGTVYVTRREPGDVLMLKTGANGLAQGAPVRVASRGGLHGIALHGDHVYLATIKEIFRGEILPDGTFGPLEMLIHDLPDAGQHPTRTVRIGPDNMMYIGVGSTTNDAHEPNPESATLLRASLDGKSRSIFASGLRDPIGWSWHPETGELWCMDHGIDWLGNDQQPEELNLVEKGKRYGWPFVYADNKINPRIEAPSAFEKAEWLRNSTPMVMGYTAHAAPMQLSFYSASQFPEEYQGDAFVSMRGSWNRKPASGYEVLRIKFRHGRPQGFETFVGGFLTADGEQGRLTGNAVAKDGSLLFTDDRNGVIYRVSYRGANQSPRSETADSLGVTPPDRPMKMQNRDGIKEPLAHESPGITAKNKALKLSSSSFGHGEPIPLRHSAYDQNSSIPLQWEGAPSGTQSFVLMMEDPDANATPLPVVHWIAWNIPPQAQKLREGLSASDRLKDPSGMEQGANYSGAVGYRGPKPPEPEKPHRYFTQLFALDAKLDLPFGSGRQEVLTAMKGHVLDVAVLEGKFKRPENPKKP